ncbi:MAG TPA: hypothetical protein VHD56_09540 [Tepidisphaeraceae bacterium]|nr:hypothetical protein [Tepidisphaeraceae bacterium]
MGRNHPSIWLIACALLTPLNMLSAQTSRPATRPTAAATTRPVKEWSSLRDMVSSRPSNLQISRGGKLTAKQKSDTSDWIAKNLVGDRIKISASFDGMRNETGRMAKQYQIMAGAYGPGFVSGGYVIRNFGVMFSALESDRAHLTQFQHGQRVLLEGTIVFAHINGLRDQTGEIQLLLQIKEFNIQAAPPENTAHDASSDRN